jgi:hypothetical protein
VGLRFKDDDSELFLFNSDGKLVAENDDSENDEFDGLQSKIDNFQTSYSGIYYVGVTTYDNNPILDADRIIVVWEDDGKSNIEFDLIIDGVTRSAQICGMLEPTTGLLLAAGLLGWVSRAWGGINLKTRIHGK